jgi:hypothetical protein
MRSWLFLGALGVGSLALLALVFISPRGGMISPGAAGEPPATVPGQEATVVEPPPDLPAANTQPNPRGLPPEEPQTASGNAKHEAWVEAKIDELRELSSHRDRASLDRLLAEVNNPDREIRQAALDGLSQTGNRDAIPALREAAAQTEEASHKQAIMEVIEFLELPTLTEVLQKQRATNQ